MQEYTATQLQQMGLNPDSMWAGSTINYNGQTYQVSDTGRGTRTLTPTGGSSSGGQSGAGGFNFDWSQAERDALEKLKPYYENLLNQHNGDVERAKKQIEEDYTNGLRISTEEQQRGNQQATEDATTQTGQENQQNQQNIYDARGQLNNRGTLLSEIQPGSQPGGAAGMSGFAQQAVFNPMQQQHDTRSMAIQRALQRQMEMNNSTYANKSQQLSTSRQRGIEDQDIQAPRYAAALNQEKQDKAINQMAPLAYQQAYQRWQYLNGQG